MFVDFIHNHKYTAAEVYLDPGVTNAACWDVLESHYGTLLSDNCEADSSWWKSVTHTALSWLSNTVVTYRWEVSKHIKFIIREWNKNTAEDSYGFQEVFEGALILCNLNPVLLWQK